MRQLVNKLLNSLVDLIIRLVVSFITANIVLYLIGLIITGVANPFEWLIFNSWWGKYILIILEFYLTLKLIRFVQLPVKQDIDMKIIDDRMKSEKSLFYYKPLNKIQ